jgi:hypothetical protein
MHRPGHRDPRDVPPFVPGKRMTVLAYTGTVLTIAPKCRWAAQLSLLGQRRTGYHDPTGQREPDRSGTSAGLPAAP